MKKILFGIMAEEQKSGSPMRGDEGMKGMMGGQKPRSARPHGSAALPPDCGF
jgi:hypothetical protein